MKNESKNIFVNKVLQENIDKNLNTQFILSSGYISGLTQSDGSFFLLYYDVP